MTNDQQRALRRVHVTGAKYGITHEVIKEWARDVHGCSTADVSPVLLDRLSRQMTEGGDDFATYFLDTYGPGSIMQSALLTMPETVDDRWVS